MFECLKSFVGRDRPPERNLGGGECREGCGHSTVATDEPSVKIGEPQEPLELLAGVRNRPGGDSRDLGGVHLDVPLANDVS